MVIIIYQQTNSYAPVNSYFLQSDPRSHNLFVDTNVTFGPIYAVYLNFSVKIELYDNRNNIKSSATS